MWVRGLKQLYCYLVVCLLVAPRVGAWIETCFEGVLVPPYSVAPRVGAWIETLVVISWPRAFVSHPVWVRGLKQTLENSKRVEMTSHPVWVRGLKRP